MTYYGQHDAADLIASFTLQITYQELTFLKQIGEGSFGRVYMARWRETTVAVKVGVLTMQQLGYQRIKCTCCCRFVCVGA